MPDLTLIIDVQNRRLVRSFTSSIQSAIPSLFQGDTLDCFLRFVQPTGNTAAPYEDIDYSLADVKVGIGSIGAGPTAGTFTLTDPDVPQTTAAIAYNASAAVVQTAVRAALTTNWSLVVVTGPDGGPWTFTNGANGAHAALQGGSGLLTPLSSVVVSTLQDGTVGLPEIQYVVLSRNPIAFQDSWTPYAGPTVSITEVQDGGASQNEVQLVTLNNQPYSGSVVLTFDNGATSGSSTPILATAAATDVQSALEANPAIGSGNVSVAGNAGGPWTVTFIGDLELASYDLMTESNTLVGPLALTGELSLNTGGIDEAIGILLSLDETFSIKVTPDGGGASTQLQTTCTIFNDLILGAPSVPTPGTTYYTQAQVNAIVAALHDSDPLSVSTTGTTQATIPNYTKTYILAVAAAAGAGAYTRTIDLEGTDRIVGDIAEVLITFAASVNPTIVVRDGVADASLIGAGQVGNGSVYTSLVRCYFDGTNWKLLSWS